LIVFGFIEAIYLFIDEEALDYLIKGSAEYFQDSGKNMDISVINH
jgi:hypothetical protein